MKAPGISTRLALWLVVVSLLPISLLTMTFLSAFQAQLSSEIEQHLSHTADRKVSEIDTLVRQRLRDVRLLARSPETQHALASLTQLYSKFGPHSAIYLQAQSEYHGYFARLLDDQLYYDLLLIAPNGDVIFSLLHETDYGTNLRSGPFRDSALAQSALQAFSILGSEISDFAFYPPSARPAAFASSPVLSDDHLLGAIALQIDPQRIHQVINNDINIGPGGETVVARQQGEQLLFMAPTRADPAAAFNRVMDQRKALYQPMLAAAHGERGQGRIRSASTDQDVFAAWRYLPGLRWGMVIKVDRHAALAPVWQLRDLGLLVMMLIVFGVLATAWLIGRSVVRPLAQLSSASTRIAAGDLGRRVPLSGFSEARQLGISFNTMAARLQTAQQQLEQRVEQRTRELEISNELLRTETQEHARASEQLRQAATVFDNSSEAIAIMRADFHIISVNQAYHRISGFGDEALLGHPPRLADNAIDNQHLLDQIRDTIASDGHWSGELTNRRQDGEAFPVWLRFDPVHDARGRLINYVAMLSDISHIKAAEQRLQELAYSDFLTGLPNRMLFRERLEQEISAARRRQRPTALLYIDLDRFKTVNDNLGHEAGDKLLIEVAQRLRRCVRDADTVARLGGDEFTLILPDLSAPTAAAAVAANVLKALTRSIRLQGHDIVIGGSIGIAVAPDDGDDRETLERHADIAMYHAKEKGRGNYQFFTADMNERSEQQLLLQTDLRQALENQHFQLLYQPIVQLRSGQPTAVEVLLRWQHPQRGTLTPADFLATAEDTGLILPIGNWVLRQACAQVARWQQAGLPPITININLSPRQFQHPELPSQISANLREHKLAPRQLALELTEAMLSQEQDEVDDTLNRLSTMHTPLLLDDFGTGHSSLASLRRMPVQCLKIDRSFIKDLPDQADACAITSAIITLASSLELQVIAEGVETEAQRDFLLEQGCDQAQGYLFAGPMDADETEAFLVRQQRTVTTTAPHSPQDKPD